MARLLKIGDRDAGPSGAVVFVHGLGGDPYNTWKCDGAQDGSFLSWLSQDLSDTAIFTLEYEADVSNWFGSAMALPDRATNVIATFLADGLDQVPLVFVCHSLGGLLVKQVLRQSADRARMREGNVVEQTRGVVFLGTPNTGSRLANWADRFRFLMRPTEATKGLQSNAFDLRDLNVWYRDNAPDRAIATLAFSETKTIAGAIVVDQSCADPDVKNVRPIPLDVDHIQISKPQGRDTTLYKTVLRFAKEQFSRNPLKGSETQGTAQIRSKTYEVFISHSSAQKDWVVCLARNLQQAGKSVLAFHPSAEAEPVLREKFVSSTDVQTSARD